MTPCRRGHLGWAAICYPTMHTSYPNLTDKQTCARMSRGVLRFGECRVWIPLTTTLKASGLLGRHLGWAAQWLEYEAELRANLSKPALTVPVFEDAVRRRLACLRARDGRQVTCGVFGRNPNMPPGMPACKEF